MTVNRYLLIGFFGALLMYIGDMFLYYTSAEIAPVEHGLLLVMAQVSYERLLIGGMLGPLAAFFYLLGFYGIYQGLQKGFAAKAILAMFSLAIIFGGAYHSQFTSLGIVAGADEALLLKLWQSSVVYLLLILSLYMLASALFIYLLARKKSQYSRWLILFCPLPMIFLGGLLGEVLVQPLEILIGGGWFNISFMLFFAGAYFAKKPSPHPL